MPTSTGISTLVIAVVAAAWGAATQFRQSRSSGPIALVPTSPFGIQSALLFTLGLFLLR
jgi:hypothetical protein